MPYWAVGGADDHAAIWSTKDLSTYLLPYVGSRVTGNGGGTYMITGPGWTGDTPKGVDGLIPSTTDFAFTVYRTQLFSPDDLGNVEKIQKGYQVQTLSAFLGQPAPTPAATLEFPDWGDQKEPGDDFISYLNFCLQYITPDAEDSAMWKKLAPIGVGPGAAYDIKALSDDERSDLTAGVAAGRKSISDASSKYEIAGQTRENSKASGPPFGS